MSIRGTIFKAEASKTHEEMIGHLAQFISRGDSEKTRILAEQLLKQLDLVKQYFLPGGSFTLEATRTLVAIKRQEKSCWQKGMPIDTCTSKDLSEKAALFWKSVHKREGWGISQVDQQTQTLRPHQMPILFDKVGSGIYATIWDTRMNFEGMRKPLFDALLPLNVPTTIFVCTQKQQHDWSTCSQVTLENLHQADHLGPEKLYPFFEQFHDSIEVQKDKKWRIIICDRLPLSSMRMVQSMADFRNYEKWALENRVATPQEMQTFKEKMKEKNPSWGTTPYESLELNNRVVSRFHKNSSKIVQRILQDKPPVKASSDKIS